MEKIIFFGLIIPILIFVVYLGGRAIMTGFSAKSSNKSSSDIESNGSSDIELDEHRENLTNNSENLSNELNQLNELLKSGALTKEEFEKAKKKILDN